MTKLNESSPSPSDKNEEAIRILRKPDKVGVIGTSLGLGAGATAGALAAGTVAGAAGATTLLSSTTLASVLGGVFVTTTPVGWVVGCGLAGGVAAYGIVKLIRSGAKSDQSREEMADRLDQNAQEAEGAADLIRGLDECRERVTAAVDREAITAAQAERILNLVSQGKLSPELAMKRLQAVVEETQKSF